jgi:hypothetical protein
VLSAAFGALASTQNIVQLAESVKDLSTLVFLSWQEIWQIP